jgi:hypothetical protein
MRTAKIDVLMVCKKSKLAVWLHGRVLFAAGCTGMCAKQETAAMTQLTDGLY